MAAIASVGAAAPAQAATTTSVFTAAVAYSDGQPVANATVRVDVMPADLSQDDLVSTPLASGQSDAQGNFTLTVQSNYDFSPYLHDDGTVSLEVNASDGTDDVSYVVREPAPASGTAASSTSSAAATSSTSGAVIPVVFGVASPSAAGSTARVSTSAAAAASPGVQGHQCISNWRTVWKLQSDYQDKDVSIVKFMTKANSTARYEWNTKNESQFEASYEYQSGNGLVAASAGFDKNVSNASGTTLRASNNATKFGAVKTRFRKYLKYCQDIFGTYPMSYASSWEWRPYEWTGATAYKSTTSVFTCNTRYRTTTPDELWVSKDVTNTFTGAFSIGSLSLRAKQSNTSSTKFVMAPDNGVSMTICGSNALPPAAAQVREL